MTPSALLPAHPRQMFWLCLMNRRVARSAVNERSRNTFLAARFHIGTRSLPKVISGDLPTLRRSTVPAPR